MAKVEYGGLILVTNCHTFTLTVKWGEMGRARGEMARGELSF
jgi:hypothetical protein